MISFILVATNVIDLKGLSPFIMGFEILVEFAFLVGPFLNGGV